MTNIAFIRHGETDSNREKLFAGKLDVELNANGIWQVVETAEKLKDYKFDAVYCGRAKRVRQTYEILSRRIEFGGAVFSDSIREIDFGSWEGLSQTEIETRSPADWNAYMETWTDFRFPDGDSVRDYFRHCGLFIRELAAANPEKTVAVIGHKGFILSCACALRGQGIELMFDAEIGNGSFFFMNGII